MCTLGSSARWDSSLAASPLVSPLRPQCQGSPTWCRVRPCTRNGCIRSVTSTRASMALRAVTMVAQPRWVSPRSAASCGETSQKNAGCNSDRYGRNLDMPPAVWCSVSR